MTLINFVNKAFEDIQSIEYEVFLANLSKQFGSHKLGYLRWFIHRLICGQFLINVGDRLVLISKLPDIPIVALLNLTKHSATYRMTAEYCNTNVGKHIYRNDLIKFSSANSIDKVRMQLESEGYIRKTKTAGVFYVLQFNNLYVSKQVKHAK
jgi:hypothetical protein